MIISNVNSDRINVAIINFIIVVYHVDNAFWLYAIIKSKVTYKVTKNKNDSDTYTVLHILLEVFPGESSR